MRIHALHTGAIEVKTRYVEAAGRVRALRLTSVLLDRQFTTIPVYTWAIEHPDGLIVVDTGLSSALTQPDFYPLVQRPYWLTQYCFHITPDGEIDAQLARRGLDIRDVRWLIITHAHFDHTANLGRFAHSRVVFSRKEWDDVQRFRSAHFDFPSKYPPNLDPLLIDFRPEPIGAFTASYPLTADGAVRLLPTPGHTLGQMSVLVEDGADWILCAADTAFNQAALLHDTLDAPAFDSGVTLATRERIRSTARQHKLIYLPTHDPDTPYRLISRSPLFG